MFSETEQYKVRDIGPVSYTHLVFLLISINLDVLIYYSAMKSTLKTLKLLADPTRLRIINAVSYTHLDVYKRQHLLRPYL